MIGQTSMFAPERTEPLRKRVEISIVPTCMARLVLEQFHYLHRGRVGRQINYAITIDGQVDGVITYAYPMLSSPICGVPSDELLEFARLYLHQNIPHTATCAIGKSLRRVQADWMQLFPDSKRPRLVVSWSDREYHTGTIYKAANFKWLRKSVGATHGNSETSKRGKRTKHGDYSHDKDCWIYPLRGREVGR